MYIRSKGFGVDVWVDKRRVVSSQLEGKAHEVGRCVSHDGLARGYGARQ